MIQFNLLPDIKIEYMRAQRTKRMVIAIATLVSAAALLLVISMALLVFVVQKSHLSNLSADIAKYSRNLSGTTDVDKILTVQNQLASLDGLHTKKPDTTRIFPYIEQLTPNNVSISSIVIDNDATTMTITGVANAVGSTNKLADVNTFVDTLKFTQYKDGDTTAKAFSSVVLASFGRSDKDASYSISLSFDPLIFSNTETIALSVPRQITTRSETEKPGALFQTNTSSRGQ